MESHTSSSSRKIDFLRSRSSGTASITRAAVLRVGHRRRERDAVEDRLLVICGEPAALHGAVGGALQMVPATLEGVLGRLDADDGHSRCARTPRRFLRPSGRDPPPRPCRSSLPCARGPSRGGGVRSFTAGRSRRSSGGHRRLPDGPVLRCSSGGLTRERLEEECHERPAKQQATRGGGRHGRSNRARRGAGGWTTQRSGRSGRN